MAAFSPQNSPIDDLERSMRQLERDFSLRDPYQSGMVSRSEFTFVLVRNGGMLTQIDALADRFQVPLSSVSASNGVRSQSATVDYIKFMKHMRQLAAGVDEDKPCTDSPATRRSLQGELGSSAEVQPPARQPPPLPPPAAVTHSPMPAQPVLATRGATTGRPAPGGGGLAVVRDAASPIALPVSTIGGASCYDWMEAVATRTSVSRSPPQPKGEAKSSNLATVFTLSPSDLRGAEEWTAAGHSWSGSREKPPQQRLRATAEALPYDAVDHHVDPGRAAAAASPPQQQQRSPPKESCEREPVAGNAAACTASSSSGGKISLREVFHIIRLSASLPQSSFSSATTNAAVGSSKTVTSVSLADIVSALERQGISGVSLPQLEALCDSLGFPEAAVNMEEFCLLVARLPPPLIEALRTRATWQPSTRLPVTSSLGPGFSVTSTTSSSIAAPGTSSHTHSDGTAAALTSAANHHHPLPSVALVSPPPPATPPGAPSSVVAAVAFPEAVVDSGTVIDSRDTSRMLHYPSDNTEVLHQREEVGSAATTDNASRTPLSSSKEALTLFSTAKRSPRAGNSGYAAREVVKTSRRDSAALEVATNGAASPPPSSHASSRDDVTVTANGTQSSQHPPRRGTIPLQRFQQPTKSSSNKLLRGARHPEPIAAAPSRSSAASSRRSTPRASPATSRTSSKQASTASSRTTSPGVRVERLSLTSAPTTGLPLRVAAAQQRVAAYHADPRSHMSDRDQQDVHTEGFSPAPAAPLAARGGGIGSAPSDALVAALSGRCADLMSLCTSVDRHRTGKLPLASLTSILHSLAPRLAPELLHELLAPYRVSFDNALHAARSPWYDYVQLVGDLIVAATPPPMVAPGPAKPHERHNLGHNASPPTYRSSAYAESSLSPTPQPRNALALRAVNPSHHLGDKFLQGVAAEPPAQPHPWWSGAMERQQRPQQQQAAAVDEVRPRSSASRSPSRAAEGLVGTQPFDPRAGSQRRSLSRSPRPAADAADEASLPLEQRVRLGRERLKKLLKHELVSAAEYQLETLFRCFAAMDPSRSGYLAEGDFRRSLLGLFRRSSRELPPWAMDRAVKIAKHPFAALRTPESSDGHPLEVAAVAAARRWTAVHSGEPSDWCDYEFLFAELGLNSR